MITTAFSMATSLDEQLQKLQAKRTRCEIWTRVIGYHRPVSQFNLGKRSEHFERKHFSEKATLKSPHARRVSTK